MSTKAPNSTKKLSAAALAEAAAWIARLHGPNRTPEVEGGLRRWMAEDPERAAAFELLTDTWEKSVRIRRRPFEQVASWQWPGFRISFSGAALGCMAVAIIAVIGTLVYLHDDGFATAIGEQRTVILEDGTRVFLNTNSRAVVHYDRQARHVELVRGEAVFEVAKRPDWPFIVRAGREQIRALGTAFLVRRDQDNMAVILVEGKVTVSPLDSSAAQAPPSTPQPQLTLSSNSRASSYGASTLAPAASAANPVQSTSEGIITLSPGERLIIEGNQAPRLDHPSLDAVTAWQRGQVTLDNTPLADAVADMNRYSTTRLIIEDPRIAAIPIDGVFRVGDSEDFAQAVARNYNLELRISSHAIVLVRPGAALNRTDDAPQ
jgi:transmembrane sensor